uniref:Uncharacterized protein n=1 Tax=Arundo donax TaxID=35708 RepID=A0A0A8Z9L4_ARUDO
MEAHGVCGTRSRYGGSWSLAGTTGQGGCGEGAREHCGKAGKLTL